MVCPITAPAEQSTGMASVRIWLPESVYTDMFSGKTYNGGRTLTLHRALGDYPVLAKPGTIVPLAVNKPGANDTGNPEQLEVLVFPGTSGSYTLFEDDGLTDNGACFETDFVLDAESKQLRIYSRGDASLIPEQRRYCITFRGVEPFTPTGETVESVSFHRETRSVTVALKAFAPGEQLLISLDGLRREENSDRVLRCRDFLMQVKMGVEDKEKAYAVIARGGDSAYILRELMALGLSRHLVECLAELLNQ